MFPRLLIAVVVAAQLHLVTTAAERRSCRLASATARVVVLRAIEGAARRLEAPDCDRLFDEFADAAGTPLRGSLAAKQLTPRELLERLVFVDGDGVGPCARADWTAAFTMPGSRVIFVCGNRMETRFRDRQKAADVLIIHELLHAAGLGENPPSSDAITSRVTKRCSA